MYARFTLEHWRVGPDHVGRLAEIPIIVARGATVAELRKNIQSAYLETVATGTAAAPTDALREPLELEFPNGVDQLQSDMTQEEWEAELDAAIEELSGGPDRPVLSDEALSRESFYEGNPQL